jgi:hypothetical protein
VGLRGGRLLHSRPHRVVLDFVKRRRNAAPIRADSHSNAKDTMKRAAGDRDKFAWLAFFSVRVLLTTRARV